MYAQFYAHVHSKADSSRSREVYLRWLERLGEHHQPNGAAPLEEADEQLGPANGDADYPSKQRDQQAVYRAHPPS